MTFVASLGTYIPFRIQLHSSLDTMIVFSEICTCEIFFERQREYHLLRKTKIVDFDFSRYYILKRTGIYEVSSRQQYIRNDLYPSIVTTVVRFRHHMFVEVVGKLLTCCDDRQGMNDGLPYTRTTNSKHFERPVFEI